MPLLSTSNFRRLVYFTCFVFFVLYSILAIVRHEHYGSFGFDLGITDQVLWEYSHFKSPLTTIHYYPYTSILTDHVELIYIPLSLFYRIWSDAKMIIILQAAFVTISAIPVYFLAKEKKLNNLLSYVILLSYLSFYGVQNALWFDVHSVTFGASFLPWFIYFLEKKKIFYSFIFFLLAILSKENIALLTFLIGFIFFIKSKNKVCLGYMILSLAYLLFVFYVYFPHLTLKGYEYQSSQGLFSDLNFLNLLNNSEKRQVFYVSLLSFGFLPFLAPLYFITALGDLFSYFVVADNLKESHNIFMHYRITLAPLLSWSTIMAVNKFKKLNNQYIGVYLLICLIFLQYFLHLPLSYLTKNWFWKEPSSVKNINKIISVLPKDTPVVSQNNITPHLSQREYIFTLWPVKKDFANNSPCAKSSCDWFRWGGKPEYLVVDLSKDWDIRHLLANRENFIQGVTNVEKSGFIKKDKQVGNAILYKVIKNPERY